MKRTLLALLTVCAVAVYSHAGVIAHTDYTAGSVITAAGQNANENTIVNEINGNLNTDNLLDGGVATVDIADNAVTYGKLATVLQSTFTHFAALRTYRRPALQYASVTEVDIENNSVTANTTCISFPTESRCVTENTSVTNKYRRFNITVNAEWVSGTEDSGLDKTLSEVNNQWYSIFAVKSQINASNFVLVGSTLAVTQANVSLFNSKWGTDGWVYIGLIRNGDQGSAAGDILKFRQIGEMTLLYNAVSSADIGVSVNSPGIVFKNEGATSTTYTYAAGVSGATLPNQIGLVRWIVIAPADAGGDYRINNAANSYNIIRTKTAGLTNIRLDYEPTEGLRVDNVSGASNAYSVLLGAWWDKSLAGANQQI